MDTPPATDSRYDPAQPPPEPTDIRRKLLFGLALILAFASMYAGLFGWGAPLQYGLALAALIAVIFAFVSGSTARR